MKKPNYTADFMKFWMAYPQVKRVVKGKIKWSRIGKGDAIVVWECMDAEDKAHALYAVQFVESGDFNLEAGHWLQRRRFDDFEIPEEEGKHLPQNLTSCLKSVPSAEVNVNDRRNKNMDLLRSN